VKRFVSHPFERAAPSGKRVAVVGAGPAGLSCAHRLAMHGHDVTILEAREKSGGLNEHGIAAYKSTDDFAAREVEFILGIGGITIQNGMTLGSNVTVDQLASDYDAVFLGMGLPNVHSLGLEGENADGCIDAVDYIETLRQSDNLSKLPVGRNVVVIGGGMTAKSWRKPPVSPFAIGCNQIAFWKKTGRLLEWSWSIPP